MGDGAWEGHRYTVHHQAEVGELVTARTIQQAFEKRVRHSVHSGTISSWCKKTIIDGLLSASARGLATACLVIGVRCLIVAALKSDRYKIVSLTLRDYPRITID